MLIIKLYLYGRSVYLNTTGIYAKTLSRIGINLFRFLLAVELLRFVHVAGGLSWRGRMATRYGGADVNDVYGLQPLCRACLKRYGPEALCRSLCLHPGKHKRSPVS